VAAAYARFREELEGLPPPTQAALHGDLGPGCFLFQGEEVSGILDFGAASYWYLLYDVASCVMYVRGYWPERAPHCRRLLSGYASAAPIDGGELRFLPLFVRCRALVQVGYFDMRVREGITQGNDLTANRRGLANGIRMLELAERLPPEHFATRARTSHRRVRAVRESRTRRTSR
jgi:Ser/Thr protein kinase RdoA (MazF antagonist)